MMFDNSFQKYLTLKNVTFLIILVLFIRFINNIADIAIMFFASYVIACSLDPLVEKLSKKYTRPKAASLVLCSALLIICLIFVPIVILTYEEIRNFAVSFPRIFEAAKNYIESSPYIANSLAENLNMSGMITSASGMTTNIVGEIISVSRSLGSGIVYLIGSVVIIYYFLADKDTVHKTFLKLFPSNMRKRANEIIVSISDKIGAYVVAQAAAILSVGIMITIGLLVLRVEYALLLGLVTAVLDIIPIVGPAIALIICLIVSYKSGIGILALIVLVFAIAQLTENNVIRPYIFSKLFDLHPIIIYLFLFITAKFLGVIGLIFAPAIAATAVILIEELYMKNIE